LRLALIFLLTATAALAQEPLVAQGYDHFYNLEYPEAIASFEQAIARHPEDPARHNHLAETYLFQEMYRDGALESELVTGTNSFLRRPKLNPSGETEKHFLGEVARAMDLAQSRLNSNPNDKVAMYDLGISYGLRSTWFWLVRKAWRDALRDATAGRKLHNRVSELDPNNVDTRLVQGLHDFTIGSLPWNWRMLGFLVGMHGDKEKGIRTVMDVAQHGNLNRVDAEFFLCAIYRRENQPAKAVPVVQELIGRFPRNYLLRLELSQMYSMAGDKTRALEAVADVARRKERHEPGYDRAPWHKIWYQEGTIQFWYRDYDAAIENLRKTCGSPEEIDLNTGATAWLRLGQIFDLKLRRPEAMDAYRKSIAFAPQSEQAQEARRYLSTPYHR